MRNKLPNKLSPATGLRGFEEQIAGVFKTTAIYPPDPDFVIRVHSMLSTETPRKNIKRWLWAFRLIFAGGLTGIIFAGVVLQRELLTSDFLPIASLLISDFKTVTGHLSSFVYSLLESMPAITFAAILASLGTSILAWSKLNKIQKNLTLTNHSHAR